jgi:hypothetical protein
MKFFDKVKDWQLLYGRIANNDPTLTQLGVYVFTTKEMQALHNAVKNNTHLTWIDIRISDNAKEYTPMMRIKLEILGIVKNNLLREFGILRHENEELKRPLMVEHNCNR